MNFLLLPLAHSKAQFTPVELSVFFLPLHRVPLFVLASYLVMDPLALASRTPDNS